MKFASATVAHSVIADNATDGLHVIDGTSSTVIQASQTTAKAGYGIRNDGPDQLRVLAADNWWGDASGPSSVLTLAPCAPAGSGQEITAGVDFLPFLTSANAAPTGPVPTSIIRVTLAPAAWFSPSDGVTRDNLTITVRDGAGNPLFSGPRGRHGDRGMGDGGVGSYGTRMDGPAERGRAAGDPRIAR